MPEFVGGLLPCLGQIRTGETWADDKRTARFWQDLPWRPGVNHCGLQLARDGQVDFFGTEQRDKSGHGAQGAASGKNGRAMIPQASGKDRNVAEASFVSIDP